MAIPSIYINLEDDVTKIVSRFKHNSSKELVLVCPKRCFLFNDSINLRLLKKQADLLGKKIFILTMDERGQLYAKEAGFELKFLPKTHGSTAMSDIKKSSTSPVLAEEKNSSVFSTIENTVTELKQIAEKFNITHHENKIESKPEQKIKTKTPVVQNAPLKVNVVDSLFPPELVESYKPNTEKKKRSVKVWVGIITVGILAILAVGLFVLPKADILVFAKTEPVTRDMEISISTNVSAVDISKLIMPAFKFDETVSLTEKFSSQGKKQVGNKAAGTVKIYNFTKLPLNLKAGTTVLTVGNKNYNLVNDISGIKPTTYKDPKIKEVDLSSLGASVEVIASDGGENFNLPAGTRMEISNQVFGSKPELLYAKTDSEITGGTTRYLSLISQEDIDNAKNSLSLKALKQIQDKLKASGLEIPEKSYISEIEQYSTDNAVGSQSPSFQASIKVKFSGISFKSNDLSNLIFTRIKQTLASNKSLKEIPINFNSIKVKNYDNVNLLAVLVVHFEGQSVFNLNLENMEGELVGKSQSEANEILRSKAEIDKVEITLAPSWQKTLPWFKNKIKISTAIE